MATRVVEGKKPYTGGEAIDIDQNKVISLKLRDENNLIIYDSGDNEIYVDLQLPDGITPTDAFPVGVTTGRAVVADGWDLAGTIICAKTTSGDNIKLLYADDGTLWIDNGTGTFKEIPLGGSAGADIEYVTQVEYDALPSSKLTDGKHYVIYTSDSPTPPSPGWQPGVNTYIYYPLKSNGNDYSGNNRNLTTSNLTFSNEVAVLGDNVLAYYNIGDFPNWTQAFTMSFWIRLSSLPSSYNLIGFIKDYNASTQFYTDWDKTIQIENDGTIIFNIYDGDSRMISTSSGYLSTNTWYNIIGIYDGSKMSMYINNTKIGEESVTGTYSTDYLVLNGYNSRNAASARWTQGDLSDFILENKARTAQEVADYYNQTKANYGIS